ncbi:hypothetical protein N657DRAFT_157920 [Parathielavia appendiculata]|uniref:Uncharacterized protein n=1 Tax=Parathielavia appendiculata TaxID=2587402 RepID=A0AAN6TTV0_9PEZI|nr:hypothetical protein N657DRAFT_157920 [Parathielavia appendiculata]
MPAWPARHILRCRVLSDRAATPSLTAAGTETCLSDWPGRRARPSYSDNRFSPGARRSFSTMWWTSNGLLSCPDNSKPYHARSTGPLRRYIYARPSSGRQSTQNASHKPFPSGWVPWLRPLANQQDGGLHISDSSTFSLGLDAPLGPDVWNAVVSLLGLPSEGFESATATKSRRMMPTRGHWAV